MRLVSIAAAVVILGALLMVTPAAANEPLLAIDARHVETGILYDRVLPLSRVVDQDGVDAPTLSSSHWQQIYHEMYRASLETPARPDVFELKARARSVGPLDPIPIAVMHMRYERLRADALKTGAALVDGERLIVERREALVEAELFAASAMKEKTYRGGAVSFVIDESWFFSVNVAKPRGIEVDLDDGFGWRRAVLGTPITAAYATTGSKTIRLRAVLGDGRVLESAFAFAVESLQAPLPDDTIAVTASIPYEGGFGSGEAYVYLADGHTALTQPVLAIEGFDIDNDMNWDELYELLNDENLLEDARAEGYDLVVLNFTDATDYMQRNAYCTLELITQVQSMVAPTTTFALIGASMGGLCGRYALSYMETHAIPHRVLTYISFDTPHNGANIPLGVQYWLDFFASESAEAAALLANLDRPAALQMLVYHHTTPPGVTGESDSLRAAFDAELAGLGDYPTATRNVAMANGGGTMADQGFNAGDQIILWEYDSFLVDVRGNVWSVPDSLPATQILQAEINVILLPADELNVTVSGTSPYDNAPGGSRASMAEMDSTEAPYGDIIALHERHCFIPTVSALDLATTDLFYDVAGDENILAITPFDAVYFPADNQPHVDITPENKTWLLDEIRGTPTAVRATVARRPELYQNLPNPFNPTTTIRFSMPEAGWATLCVYDVRGALVATLFDGHHPMGEGATTWNGRSEGGASVASGVYFYRLAALGEVITRKMVLVK